MTYTYEQLKNMTVADLRSIADGIQHEAVKGHLTMHKDVLLPAICLALGIQSHEHHEAKGIDKAKVKLQIRALKRERESALQAHDPAKLRKVREEIKTLKRKLRKALA